MSSLYAILALTILMVIFAIALGTKRALEYEGPPAQSSPMQTLS